MKRVFEDYLRDMLENAEKARSFVKGMDYDGFRKDDKAFYAVIPLTALSPCREGITVRCCSGPA